MTAKKAMEIATLVVYVKLPLNVSGKAPLDVNEGEIGDAGR